MDRYEDGVFTRLLESESGQLLIDVTQRDPSALRVTAIGERGTLDVAALVKCMLGIDVDLDPFARAASVIPWLAPIVRAARGVRPPRYPSIWETCVNAIVYQHVSIHAAGAILRRLVEHRSDPVTFCEGTFRPFPSARSLADVDTSQLRALGLSNAKIIALRAVAEAAIGGAMDRVVLGAMSTKALMHSLTSHKGIGPWTAAVIALRGFGRLDLFPMNDSGVARNVKELSGDSNVDIESVLDRLGEQRGMLYYYLLLDGLARRGEIAL